MSATLSSEVIEIRFSTQAAMKGAVGELQEALIQKCPYEYEHFMKTYFDENGSLLAHIFAGDHVDELMARIVKVLARYDQGSEIQVLRPSQ